MNMKHLFTCTVLALALTGCGIISRPVVSMPPARCASLVPSSWSEGVDATPVPDTAGLTALEAIQAWAGAYVGMSAQLEKANGRTSDTVEIVSRCEELVNAARADQ